jgi:branched-chain amino acid aminotransferase
MKRFWHGKGLAKSKLALSALDRGLTLGDGLFETLAVHDSVALWRFEHLERMRKSASELGIPFPEDAIENAIDALTRRAKGHHVLRLTLTRGKGGRGLVVPMTKPTLLGTLTPFDSALRFQPAALITASVRRNLHAPSSRHKTLSYIDQIVAAREAEAAGADEALMLNSAGRVACVTIGNLFVERKGALETPSLAEGILPGIMRAALIAAARLEGIAVREKQLRVADLAGADGVWVSNSLRFVRPVTRLDKLRYPGRSRLLDRLVRRLLAAEQEQIMLN